MQEDYTHKIKVENLESCMSEPEKTYLVRIWDETIFWKKIVMEKMMRSSLCSEELSILVKRGLLLEKGKANFEHKIVGQMRVEVIEIAEGAFLLSNK